MSQGTNRFFIASIQAAFNLNDDIDKINTSDIPDLESLALRQNVLPIVTFGLKKMGFSALLSESMNNFEAKSVYDYTQRNIALKEIYNVFDKFSIPYIPLKGSVLQDLYPHPWMRTCSDIDILVHKEDLNKAIHVLNSNTSFKYYKHERHDVHFVNQHVHLELHFNFDYSVEKIDSALVDPWNYAIKSKNSYRYDFSSEFMLFYIICHAAKHFILNGGIGIRNFLDIYLLKTFTSFDEIRVKEMCNSAGILGFYCACCKLIDVWFHNDTHDEISIIFEEIVLSGGVFGSKHLNVLSNKSQNKGKKYLLFRVFKSHKELQRLYPKCKKYPFLLPVYQVKRWSNVFKHNKFKEYLFEYKHACSVEYIEIEKYENLMKNLGL